MGQLVAIILKAETMSSCPLSLCGEVCLQHKGGQQQQQLPPFLTSPKRSALSRQIYFPWANPQVTTVSPKFNLFWTLPGSMLVWLGLFQEMDKFPQPSPWLIRPQGLRVGAPTAWTGPRCRISSTSCWAVSINPRRLARVWGSRFEAWLLSNQTARLLNGLGVSQQKKKSDDDAHDDDWWIEWKLPSLSSGLVWNNWPEAEERNWKTY